MFSVTNCVRKSGTACILLYLLQYYFLSVHTRFALCINIIFSFSIHFVTTALSHIHLFQWVCYYYVQLFWRAAVLCWLLLAGYMLIIIHLSSCDASASVCGCMICLGVHAYVLLVQHLFFPSSSILQFPFYLPCYYLWPCSMCPMLDLVGCSSCILLWVCCISVVTGTWLQAICLAGHVNYTYMPLFLFPLLGLVLSPPSSYFMII
jgi:hypothetical protein